MHMSEQNEKQALIDQIHEEIDRLVASARSEEEKNSILRETLLLIEENKEKEQ